MPLLAFAVARGSHHGRHRGRAARHLWSFGEGSATHVWDLGDPPDAELLKLAPDGAGADMGRPAFHPDGRWMAASYHYSSVALWPLGLPHARVLPGHTQGRSCPSAFRPTRGLSSTLDLNDPEGIPYFLWDEPMTVSELRARLDTTDRVQRLRLLGRILREARDTDVWRFTTTAEVIRSWPELQRHLGRRRAFWQFLLERWQDLGLDGRP